MINQSTPGGHGTQAFPLPGAHGCRYHRQEESQDSVVVVWLRRLLLELRCVLADLLLAFSQTIPRTHSAFSIFRHGFSLVPSSDNFIPSWKFLFLFSAKRTPLRTFPSHVWFPFSHLWEPLHTESDSQRCSLIPVSGVSAAGSFQGVCWTWHALALTLSCFKTLNTIRSWGWDAIPYQGSISGWLSILPRLLLQDFILIPAVLTPLWRLWEAPSSASFPGTPFFSHVGNLLACSISFQTVLPHTAFLHTSSGLQLSLQTALKPFHLGPLVLWSTQDCPSLGGPGIRLSQTDSKRISLIWQDEHPDFL